MSLLFTNFVCVLSFQCTPDLSGLIGFSDFDMFSYKVVLVYNSGNECEVYATKICIKFL